MRKGTGKKKGTGTGTGTETGAGVGTGTEIKKAGRPKGSKSGYTVSDKALAQRLKAGKNLPFTTAEEKDYNARLIEHSLMTMEIANHADTNDPESMRACFINYMRLCVENGFKIGNMGACAAMGISVRTIYSWRDRVVKAQNPEFKKLADFVLSVCSLAREQMITDQKINPVIGIFWQRNFDGLRNDTEQLQQLADNNENNDQMTIEEYKKKYGKLIDN